MDSVASSLEDHCLLKRKDNFLTKSFPSSLLKLSIRNLSQELIKQMQLAEMVIARAKSLKFKFRDALAAQKKRSQEVGGAKNIEEFLSALMEKPEVSVIGAGRGPAGRVIHRLFAKQEVT